MLGLARRLLYLLVQLHGKVTIVLALAGGVEAHKLILQLLVLVVLVLQIAGNLGLHRGRHSGVVWNLGRLRLIQIHLAVPVRR